MENPRDMKAVSEIAKSEYSIAIADIGKRGWRPAQASHRERHERMTDEVMSRSKTRAACAAGCWYCCYYRVDARAEEVFAIVDFVRARFDQDHAKALREEIFANAKKMRGLSGSEQYAANLKCPFLVNGQCSIYEVRPTRCRNFHATDVEGCKKSYEQPTNRDIPTSYIPDLFMAQEANTDGFTKAIVDSGLDATTYELNSALAVALIDSTPRKKFENGKRAFSSAIAVK